MTLLSNGWEGHWEGVSFSRRVERVPGGCILSGKGLKGTRRVFRGGGRRVVVVVVVWYGGVGCGGGCSVVVV